MVYLWYTILDNGKTKKIQQIASSWNYVEYYEEKLQTQEQIEQGYKVVDILTFYDLLLEAESTTIRSNFEADVLLIIHDNNYCDDEMLQILINIINKCETNGMLQEAKILKSKYFC